MHCRACMSVSTSRAVTQSSRVVSGPRRMGGLITEIGQRRRDAR
ncbi:hypothetical protein EVAR_101131_1, partial [Eumeta japonica]